MKLHYNVGGPERKRLVTALGEVLNAKPKYLGMPSMAYEVGGFTVDKNGELNFNDSTDRPTIARVAECLASEGFIADNSTEATEGQGNADSEPFNLNISVPRSSLDEQALENLRALLEAKGDLIRHALAIDVLPVQTTEEEIIFPWFKDLLSADEVQAYSHFILALCEMAKTQQRVNPTKKQVENEKYVFRCFLLRLGFIGDAYKQDRKILLRNLSGSSAFKTAKSEVAEAAGTSNPQKK